MNRNLSFCFSIPLFTLLISVVLSIVVSSAAGQQKPVDRVINSTERGLAPVPSNVGGTVGNKTGPGKSKLVTKGGSDSVVLNFSDASLQDVMQAIGELTETNFLLAPGISGKITIQTTKPISRKDVFGVFESVLTLNGLSAVKSGEYYKIVSSAGAKQLGIEVRSEDQIGTLPAGDSLITQIIPVEFIASNDLVQVIQPTLSKAGSIFNYNKGNILVVTDVSSNITKVLEIISLLDVDSFKRMHISLIPVEGVDINVLNKELSDILAALGLGKQASQLAIVPIERLNSLVVFSPSAELLESVKGWIERLEESAPTEVSTHIYYVVNDDASNIKTILEQIYLTSGASPEAKRNIKFNLYEPRNALIIRASLADYQKIIKTLKDLDMPPKQVLVDALVVEITLDETTKFGIQWSALTGNVNVQQNTGIFSTTINNPRSDISTPIGLSAPTGLSVFATDVSKFFGVIQALASDGKVNVLSNPHIMVKNNEKASITVGSDEPIATQSTQTAVTGTASLIQNIEYRKTGIILTVTPRVTEGGLVSMAIRQEISDISTSRIVGEGTFPSFTKREAETSVVAKDRETIVIGGLIEEKKDKSISGIPLLSRIPLMGNLFKFTTVNNEKTELVILLTPTVILDSGQAATITEEFKKKLKGLKDRLGVGDSG